jgi:hypothetical protein
MRHGASSICVLLAAMALVAPAFYSAFAAGSHAGRDQDGGSNRPAQLETQPPPAAGGGTGDRAEHDRHSNDKGDQGNPVTGDEPGGGPPAAGAVNENDIDTSISVQPPRRLGGKHENQEKLFLGQSNARSVVHGHLSARHPAWRGPAAGGIGPNAIGMIVAHPDGLTMRSGGRRNFSAYLHGAAHAGMDTVGSATDHSAQIEIHPVRPTANANALIKPPSATHRAVNGSTFAHVGFGPAHIGGPSGVIAGIDGSTIKPRR